MSQPTWKFVTNLGDANPIDHGGRFLYTDETGVYDPEVEVLEIKSGDTDDEYNDDDELEVEGDIVWEIHRFSVESCTYGMVIDGEFKPLDHLHPQGVLSDNEFHPDHAAWFAKPECEKANRPQDTTYLSNICESMDVDQWELIEMFLSDDVTQRAQAWLMVADYHGIDCLDSYPIEYDSRKELEERYGDDCIRPSSF